MTRSRRALYVAAILFVLIAADHLTKWVAIKQLRDTGQTYTFLGDFFRLVYAENAGAFLSLGAGLPPQARAAVMIGLNAVILTGLLCYLFAAKHIHVLPACALTLIAGGGIGNLIDRVFRDGRVVDFMNMGIRVGDFQLRTGIFNIADIAIMAGLMLIIVNELLGYRAKSKDSNSSPSPPAS